MFFHGSGDDVQPCLRNGGWSCTWPGGDEGLAAGALPPAGFYFINDFVMLPTLITYGPLFDYNFEGGPVPTHTLGPGGAHVPVKNQEGISNEKLISDR